MSRKPIEPTMRELLDFCAGDPIERVFLEDVARRGYGRFVAMRAREGLRAVCHVGTNIVPSGEGCSAFADVAARSGARMLIGEERAVSELWDAARRKLPSPREDRPGQPVYAITRPPAGGDSGVRAATLADLDVLVPACAAAHYEEIGIDPLRRDPAGFRLRTRLQIEEGRSWIWAVDGVIRFKAEASAWTPAAVQLQQVWTDPAARRRGYARRGLADLIRLLLANTPAVTLFVRRENLAAIQLYDSIGMHRVLTYRSVLL
jgi:ribosomal protein S18 acetylase RimI-like enzyme